MHRKKDKYLMKSENQKQILMQSEQLEKNISLPQINNKSQVHNIPHSDSGIQNRKYSQIHGSKMSKSYLNQPSVYSNNSLNQNPDMDYKQYIFKYGTLGNVQSASTLQHSSLIWSVPQGPRFPDYTYKGIDSLSFKPPTDFTPKFINWRIEQEYGKGMSKGPSLGVGERTDFTDPYKKYPAPVQYQPPLLLDKFARFEILKKQNKFFKAQM